MTRTRLVVAASLLALLAGTAFAAPKKKKGKKKKAPPPAAEVAPEPEPTPTPEPTPEPAPPTPEPAAATPPEGGGGAGGIVGVETGTGGAAAGGDVAAGATVSAAWPEEIILRPPTLVKGLLQFDATVPIDRVTVVDAMGGSSSTTVIGLGLEAGYGVSDKIELGAGYALSLKDFEAKGTLNIYGKYSLVNSAKMKAAVVGTFFDNFLAKVGGISAGLQFQYNLGPKMAVYMPGTHLRAAFLADGDVKPIDFSLPAGFAYQATKQIYAFAQTNIATINITDSATAFIFADYTPLTVGAFYGMSNKMEFGAQIVSSDVAHIGDNIGFALVGRFFMGDALKAPAMAQTTATAPAM